MFSILHALRMFVADMFKSQFRLKPTPARNGLTIVPASVTTLDQRVLELWLIAPGDKPRSLGLIEPERPVHINLPAE